MTICVAISVFDGIVFAADSATSLSGVDAQGRTSIMNVYQHGNKVFNLLKGHPVAAMTCGLGNFGRAPIAALSKDLRHALVTGGNPYSVDPDNFTIADIATKAHAFFSARYAAIMPAPVGDVSFDYWIGGFSTGSELHELWQISMQNGVFRPATECSPAGECGVVCGGQPEAISRLAFGFDPRLPTLLAQAGMPQPSVNQLLTVIGPQLQANLVSPSMPIQDAIHLADFLVETTKRYVRFLPGADTVGGDTDIAVVTRHERFKWIARKHYYDSTLNLVRTDHV